MESPLLKMRGEPCWTHIPWPAPLPADAPILCSHLFLWCKVSELQECLSGVVSRTFFAGKCKELVLQHAPWLVEEPPRLFVPGCRCLKILVSQHHPLPPPVKIRLLGCFMALWHSFLQAANLAKSDTLHCFIIQQQRRQVPQAGHQAALLASASRPASVSSGATQAGKVVNHLLIKEKKRPIMVKKDGQRQQAFKTMLLAKPPKRGNTQRALPCGASLKGLGVICLDRATALDLVHPMHEM
eukprot:1159460-Pelagomonas_calceolata.AAC.6